MSSFRVNCPKCGVSLSIPEQNRGQKVRCGGCGESFRTKPGNHKVSSSAWRNAKPIQS